MQYQYFFLKPLEPRIILFDLKHWTADQAELVFYFYLYL